ncbi:dermonecrotic toxin domain-containing protein [Pseudomonas sp. RL_5y_Pfl2_70]|uniref:dermonecrotic toxin domain-containing protein n=1 Tax=Pseudomonas sp. RL_5y_Pfl2_70 TaxID=3088712 RepID=UPI0030DA1586
MDVERTKSSLPVMTPAQQGVFFGLYKKQMPSWLLKASEPARNELYESLKNSFRSRHFALEQLRTLKSPHSFCTPLLASAMAEKLGEPFEVEGAIFQHVRSTSSLLGLHRKLVLPIDRDLLTAACENFELSETLASNYHERSLLYIPKRVTGRANQVLTMQPHEFARLCRYLDLGKQYQKHVEALFGGDDQVASLQETSVAYSKDQFDVDRHIARLRGHISLEVFQMLESVRDKASLIKLGNNALGYQNLEMLGVTLRGPMFIGPVSEHADDDYRCVIYIPGDPVHPLKEYVSFQNFEFELSGRLRNPEFRNFFLRFISMKDRSLFLTGLDLRLLKARSGQLPVSATYLHLTGIDLEGDAKQDLFLAIFQHRAAQVRADARLLVVPTDDEDEKTRLARLDTYKAIGLNTALFVISFVPLLGQVMCAVAGLQLLGEIYEGIDSWAHGDQEHATDCLFDTLENLILMAGFAAGGVAAGKAYRVVRSSNFIKGLRRVRVDARSYRLWNPDMSAYRQHKSLPSSLSTDAQGLVWRGNEGYVSLGPDAYAVRPVSGTRLWEVHNPVLPKRYSPVLETNGAGAWRHDSELPHEWSSLTLFRRLGFQEAKIPDARALQIIAASNIDETAMRQLFVERGKPMAALTDTVRRFRADTEVTAFMKQMAAPATAPQADADLQLYLLTETARWPRDMAIVVTDITANEVMRYGGTKGAREVKINEDLLSNGQFYPPLLAALNDSERSHLLGSTTVEPKNQSALLGKHIAALAPRMRMAMMDRLFRRTDVCELSRGEPIIKAFPGLSASVADELAYHADAHEWEQLDADTVPLRLAEEARRYRQIQRLNRAYEGLYLDAASGRDADMLVLDTLTHLPGWPGDVLIEILDWAVYADQRAIAGPDGAEHQVLLEAYAERYQGLDSSSHVVSSQPERTRANFFQTLWQSLPEHARKALGVDADPDGTGLRAKITALALQRREAFAKVLGVEALRDDYRSPMGLADRQAEQPVAYAMPVQGLVPNKSPVLIRRALELYPSPSMQIDRFVSTLNVDDVLAIRTLEVMREEYRTILGTLERWIQRDTWYHDREGVRLKVSSRSKTRAAQAILRAWRKETRTPGHSAEGLYSLTFDAAPLGDLPVIIGDFAHVTALRMNGVGASAGLNAFLRNFTRLRVLDLSGNELTRIPQAVADMPGLTGLDLSNNQILLNEQSAQALGSKAHLRSLDLSLNKALGQVPVVSAMRNLRHLDLHDTGITQWPAGIDGLTHLETLDLRNNKIVEVPAPVFKSRAVLNRGTHIDGNPLSANSLQAIADYQRAQGISLGVITPEYLAAQRPEPDVQGGGWIRGLSSVQISRATEVLLSLSANPDSRAFFDMLMQLRGTADYFRVRAQLGQRVWDVLEAACEDDRLRRVLFRMAREGRASAANVSLLFSDLEVRVLCYRAAAVARTGSATLEGDLVRLLRGLFRLQELESQVVRENARRARTESLSLIQAQDISLIYRVRLAGRLQLPAQPTELNVRLDAEVTDEQIDKAYLEVVKAENSSRLSDSISRQEFWAEYLLTSRRDAFAEILDRSARAFALLESQVSLSREAAAQQMTTIHDNFRNESLELRKQLTDAALARHPGLPLPVTSGPNRLGMKSV